MKQNAWLRDFWTNSLERVFKDSLERVFKDSLERLFKMLTGEALATFRQDTWHSAPKLFKSAIDVSQLALSARDICRLTENELVESRLVNTRDYSLTLGPFELKETGETLIPKDHLLMVHSLEAHFDVIDEMLKSHFGFIPRWQIDDVMATIGDEGSSCGPHFDRYDVFLLQLNGEKDWQFDAGGHVEADLRQDAELRLLDSFDTTESQVQKAGDVLYIPPGVGHWGISQNDSVTLSVGIRNPGMHEFVAELSEFVLAEDNEQQLLDDELHTTGARLAPGVSERLGSRITQMLNDPQRINDWYGMYVTRLREPELINPAVHARNEELIQTEIENGKRLHARLPSRFCYQSNDAGLSFYANGEKYQLDSENEFWVSELCSNRVVLLATPLSDSTLSVVTDLINEGVCDFR